MKWPDDKAEDDGLTVWTAADDTKWFSPSESSFMINYRVDNLDELLDQLKQNGVESYRGRNSRNGNLHGYHGPDGSIIAVMSGSLAALIAGENSRAPLIVGFLLLAMGVF